MRPPAIRSRIIAERWERTALAFVALLGAMALFSFGRHVWDAGASRSEPPGLIVRSEFRTIYAPRAIIDVARAHPAIATNDELVRLVLEARLEAWFGVVFRCYQDNGDVVDIAMAIRPGESPQVFENTRAVLCLLAGDAGASPAANPAEIEIEVIEDALMKLEPIEGLRRLLWRGPGRRLADDCMPRPARTGGRSRLLQRTGPGIPPGGGIDHGGTMSPQSTQQGHNSYPGARSARRDRPLRPSQRQFASSAVEDAALSAQPTVALRASVRRHRRAQGGRSTLRSIRPKRATTCLAASVDPTEARYAQIEVGSAAGCPAVRAPACKDPG
jgi:hypothetical protein